MDKYILQLLENNKRIIIPGIGAFIIRQEKPKDLVFNNLLTFNDGILTAHVSKEEGIEYSEAAKKVEEFSKGLKTELEQKNKIHISGLGVLYQDDSGDLQFATEDVTPPVENKITEGKEGSLLPGPGEEHLPFFLDESESAADISIPGDPSEELIDTDLPPDTGEPPFIIDEKTNEPADAETIEPEEPKETIQTESETKPSDKIMNSEPEHEPLAAGQRKKNNALIIFISIPAILILLAVLTMVFFPDTFLSIFKKDEPVDLMEETVTTGQPMIEDSQPEQTVSSSESSEPPPSDEAGVQENESMEQLPSAQTGKYYVVAGCFRSQENAVNYVKTLRGKGYNATIIGMRKGLHAVSFTSSDNKSEALNEMEKIRREYEPLAWVLYY